MNKLLITAAALAVFMINSPAMAASDNDLTDLDSMSTAERALMGETAQAILNRMACADKDKGDKIKDSTDGKTHICP